MNTEIKLSPLQEVTKHTWGDFRLYLKREDLLKPAGGNKVRRFDAFFQQKGHISAAMTISNPGSHSFHVLSHYLKPGSTVPGMDALYILERLLPISPYHKSLRQDYLLNPYIKVIQANIGDLLWKQNMLNSRKVTKIGMGGHVHLNPNPYIPVMGQCVDQLKDQGIFKNVQHYFPIASGNMADGFLDYIEQWDIESQSLHGIMTGALASRWLLRWKYRKQKNIQLIRPMAIDYDSYKELAKEFHAVTGVWLDPVHTIQFINILRKHTHLKGHNIVLWMTQPHLDKLIF